MTKNNLGLPLEYQQLPEYFDIHNINDDTDTKNSIIEKLLKKYYADTVLDLTCGTGSQVFYLVERGYQVVGADFSPALIKQAQEKAQQKNLDLQFLDGDMRTVQVGNFDAVITIFNSIGHVSKEDFAQTLQNIRKNLKDGGVYIFDIFNLQAMTDQVVTGLIMDIKKVVNGVNIHNIQHSTIDKNSGLLTSYDKLVVENNGKIQAFENKFSLQIYRAKELQNILNDNGFDVLEQSGFDGSNFVEDKSLSILTVAKKR